MSTYNSISDIKRIAFIDNLTDTKARDLSRKYPFAICYASEEENKDSNIDANTKWIPGFWKAGQRYGIQKVDINPIRIGEYVLTLECVNNVLKLNGVPRINKIEPFIVKSYYSDDAENNINIQSDIIEEITDADVIKIYNNTQSVICSFDYYNNEIPITQSDGYPSLYAYDGNTEDAYTFNYSKYLGINRLNYESNQYQISALSNSDELLNRIFPVSFVITDNVHTELKFEYHRFPDNIDWINNNYVITEDLTIDNETESINIDFAFNNDILEDGFNFYFSIETTDENVVNETTDDNEISPYLNHHCDDSADGFITNVTYDYSTNHGIITLNTAQRNGEYTIITNLVDFDKYHNPLSAKKATTNITLQIGDWIDDSVYYIGEFNSEFNTESNISPDTFASAPNMLGWHHIVDQQPNGSNLYYYEEHPLDTYSIANNLCIIIPADCTFCLPIFDNNTLTNRIEDTVYDNDNTNNTFVSSGYPKNISVYHKNYKLYKFNNTLLSFINSIVNQ